MTDQEETNARPVMTRLSEVTVLTEFLHMHVLALKRALEQARPQLGGQTIQVKFARKEPIGFGVPERDSWGDSREAILGLPIFGLCGDLDEDGLVFNDHAGELTIGQLADIAERAEGLVNKILKALGPPPGLTRHGLDSNS